MHRLLPVLAGSLVILLSASCSETHSPTAPDVPLTTSFTANIMDADTHRVCIENASAEIIAGPSSGTTYPQSWLQCMENSLGFSIGNLPVGATVRIRASAPGYMSVERDFVIGATARSSDINLKRAG